MLQIYRNPMQPARVGSPRGQYRQGAFVLLLNGEVLAEIVVLSTRPDPWNPEGALRVNLGVTMPEAVRLVRADAWNRPDGPSYEWLREREQWFNETLTRWGGTVAPTAETVEASRDAHGDDARYTFRAAPLGPNDSHASSPAPRPSGRYADRRWE